MLTAVTSSQLIKIMCVLRLQLIGGTDLQTHFGVL